MIKWAGWLIVLFPGIGHTTGSLIESAPKHADEWLDGTGWTADANAMDYAEATLWYTVFSFGVPFLVIGLLVLWMDRHGITPPAFLAWLVAGWTLITVAVGGPSPLLVLLLVAGLLLAGSRRAARNGKPGSAAAVAVHAS
ncbi:hypothetical protein IU438_21340 [Nocardia cyriacigeorgica]|uniref:DUF6463 family protein n=1 Tax=Nocardia cyriacigeorgica TaxID=135487 RepID=UPI00030B7686|nr:DUF6463 family protein [Nocardia cyriacigeorgica]MBF6398331.1 hypothetical protein [Nocardia cyriacigeorgica]MBF6404155.1 hypothetical protein [Nocardia cyriacigeorgica]TLF54188.1 hypothetical protein FEK31_25215 [Nocardia cyriacigeorgica]